MTSPYYLSHQRKSSPSVKIKRQLDYPVIDTDLHAIEYTPVLAEYISQEGGGVAVDQFRAAVGKGFGYLGNRWYDLDQQGREDIRAVRPPWWALPTKNTLDLATASLPGLLHERLQEQGTDFAVLFPNIATFVSHVGNADLRRVLVRAVNRYNADAFRPYADRLTPVAAIPLHTPEEGIEALEYAVGELGLKVALIPGYINRPIKGLVKQVSAEALGDVGPHLTWLDTYGIDSEYDYDPFWQKVVDLKVNLTTHSAGMGWTARSSISSYMYNHIGHFADASHALAKSLFFGGVTRRFPDLRVGFLEGGAAWGAGLFADLIGHWEKRSAQFIDNYDPSKIDSGLLLELFNRYGDASTGGRAHSLNDLVPGGAIGLSNNSKTQDYSKLDDFAAAGIGKAEDIIDRFVPNFYFGAEADDPSVAFAFQKRINPFGVSLNAFWGSDSGHWDVPDLTSVLADTWALVERGALSEDDFRVLVFENPHRFYSERNPNFFDGTAIAGKAKSTPAKSRPALSKVG